MSDNKARERILKAAKEIFSEKGFDGARMDPIAQTAGVNKALIYYYFKSK
jgi:TetR/AcrR family transcriptional regulator